MPKFPDLLLNNNPNAPSVDLNDLQVKGVGIFADKAERDLLDANIQTEGYLAIMKDDDNLYVYIGGGWTTATNWVRVSGTLQVAEVDGSPIGDVSVLAFPPSTLTITGPIATVNLSGYATAVQLAALQTEVDNIETALGIEITGIAPPTDPGDILISDGTNFGVSVYSLPTTDGSAGQFLQTDGLGNVSFATISATLEGLTDTPVGYGTAGQVLITNGVDGFTFGSGSPWVTDTNGINYQAGNVGIGAASSADFKLLARGRADIADSNNNTIIGLGAAPNVTTATNSVIIGGSAVTGASWNFSNSVAIGYQAGQNVSGATGQGGGIFIGSNSGNWSGAYYGSNVSIGSNSGNAAVALGESAGANSSGDIYSVVIGRQAEVSSSGTVVGCNADARGGKIAIGHNATATGLLSIAIGGSATYQNSYAIGGTVNGNFGVAIGTNSAEVNSVSLGYSLVSGSSDTIQIGTLNGSWQTNQVSTGNPASNIILGNNIVQHNAVANANAITNYTSNVLIGSSIASYPSGSLSDNVIIGQGAYGGTSYVDTGSDNVIIGRSAGSAILAGNNLRPLSGNVLIGNEVGQDVAISNRLYIHNSNTTTPLIYGEFDNTVLRVNGTLQINDPAGTGYAFPAATGTLDQVLKVDANGDLVFGADNAGLWTADTNGITYSGHVGVNIASDVTYPLSVGGSTKIGGRLSMYSDAAQTAGNISIGFGGFTVSHATGTNSIALGGIVTSNQSQSILIGYNITGVGQDFVIGSSGYYYRCVIASTNSNVGSGAVAIYKATAATGGVAIGQAAGAQDYGVAIGVSTKSGTDGISVGMRAGEGFTSAATGNVCIGREAGYLYYNPGGQDYNYSVNVGYQAGRAQTTGLNVNVGYQTGYHITGGNNVHIGYRAGYGAVGSQAGSNNVIIGYEAGKNETVSTSNVVLGYQAGYNLADTGNVFIGEGAGYNATGAGNVMIGTRAGFSETGDNKLYISSGQGNDLIYGEFDNRLVRVEGNLQRMIFGGTETTTSGTIHIRNNTNWATQADATNNTASTGLLGIAQGSQANAGLILFGDVDYTIVGNVGDPVYLNTTAGGFTTTAPTASGNIVRVMGYIIGSNKIFFNPSNDWLEIV